MNFLVVDDSKVARTKISKYIIELGYHVIGEAEDGLEACEMAKKLKPDFITMDLEMPEMNGIDAAKEIISLSKDIDIIIITSIIDKKVLIDALRNGVKKVLRKPISLENLRQAIDELK